MKQRIMVLTLVLSIVLACSQLSVQLATPSWNTPLNPANAYPTTAATAFEPEPMTGILNPVTIEFCGRPSGPTVYGVGRTDVSSVVNGEAWFPAGAPGNLRSAQCVGGHFLVGPGGQADFGSRSGTISLWIKWDDTASQGRFWGQDSNFETRWFLRRLTLDWGSDTTLRGYKDDWTRDHWYFLAISWNETSNRLVIFWGDESTTPSVDVETDSWTRSVVGLHTENNIMSSRGMPNAQVLGHIDDFRYYDRERTLEEIQSDYRIPLTIFDPHLVHYYKFEDDLSDAVSSGNLVASGNYQYSTDVFSNESGWATSEVTIDVRDLKRLYALNGTFEDGNPGMNVNWLGDGQ